MLQDKKKLEGTPIAPVAARRVVISRSSTQRELLKSRRICGSLATEVGNAVAQFSKPGAFFPGGADLQSRYSLAGPVSGMTVQHDPKTSRSLNSHSSELANQSRSHKSQRVPISNISGF